MKPAEDWVFDGELSKYWNAAGPIHPDDYDPTSEEVIALIEAVQRDAIESAAKELGEAIEFEQANADEGRGLEESVHAVAVLKELLSDIRMLKPETQR